MTQEPQNSQDKPSPSFWDRLLKGDGENPPLAQHPGVVIGTLIFLFPVGAYCLWRYTKWDYRLKWGLMGGAILIIVLANVFGPSPATGTETATAPSGSSSTNETAAINTMALLVVNLITENNSWRQMPSDKFNKLMQQAAKELGFGNKSELRHLLSITPAVEKSVPNDAGRQMKLVNYGDEVTCAFFVNNFGEWTLFYVTVKDKKYSALGVSNAP